MSRGALVVFAKQPRPGQVKTRLTPPFTPEQAAAFYAEMLADVLEVSAAAAARLELDALLAVAPEEAVDALVADAPPGFRGISQRGDDLSERMSAAVEDCLAEGVTRVLLRGSDSPALEEETLVEALGCLDDDHDLVLCPDLDGGYNLVGLSRPAPGLFDHPMSTERVLDETLANARRLGLRSQVLAPRFDVDTVEDLALLARARAEGRGAGCRRTFAWLDTQDLWPRGGAG